jgi:hypothetical protein
MLYLYNMPKDSCCPFLVAHFFFCVKSIQDGVVDCGQSY